MLRRYSKLVLKLKKQQKIIIIWKKKMAAMKKFQIERKKKYLIKNVPLTSPRASKYPWRVDYHNLCISVLFPSCNSLFCYLVHWLLFLENNWV